jgi:hypothetical protein
LRSAQGGTVTGEDIDVPAGSLEVRVRPWVGARLMFNADELPADRWGPGLDPVVQLLVDTGWPCWVGRQRVPAALSGRLSRPAALSAVLQLVDHLVRVAVQRVAAVSGSLSAGDGDGRICRRGHVSRSGGDAAGALGGRRRWLREVDPVQLRHDEVPQIALMVALRVLQHASEVLAQLLGVDAFPDQHHQITHRGLLAKDVLSLHAAPPEEGTVCVGAIAG